MNKAQKPNNKVFVGLSGGVDSSVTAALLKEQGYEVTGVFIKVWHPDFLPCNWKEDRLDAMRVCAKLDIPFLTFDFEAEYKKEVVDYMINEYKAGRTPNPDVMCNKYVKFGAFLKKAREMGADYVATGHYAQNKEVQSGSGTFFALSMSADTDKDQTYFLWTLTQNELKYILFPIGHLTKPDVRKLAKKYGLITAEKKDSQGLCFVGKVDMREFLQNFIEKKSGDVLNEKGEVVGHHEGAYFYTIGQRHGFIISKKTTNDKPLYVISKDITSNTLTVSDREKTQEDLFETAEIKLEKVNWSLGKLPVQDKMYRARIRYRQPLDECTIKTSNLEAVISFNKPQIGASKGQSVVIYDGEICIGGGIIE